MKHWLVLAILVVAACEKTSDVPAMQHEMAGMVKNFTARFDDLDRRGGMLTQRLKALPRDAPELIDANNKLADAGNLFRTMRDILGQVPKEINAAVESSKPDGLRQITDTKLTDVRSTPNAEKAPPAPPTDLELELGLAIDALHHRLDDGYVEINSALDAVESTLALAETHLPGPPAKPGTEPKTEPAAPAPEGASAAGSPTPR